MLLLIKKMLAEKKDVFTEGEHAAKHPSINKKTLTAEVSEFFFLVHVSLPPSPISKTVRNKINWACMYCVTPLVWCTLHQFFRSLFPLNSMIFQTQGLLRTMHFARSCSFLCEIPKTRRWHKICKSCTVTRDRQIVYIDGHYSFTLSPIYFIVVFIYSEVGLLCKRQHYRNLHKRLCQTTAGFDTFC